MRIAAIGDVHSNHIALEKALDWVYSNGIDGIIFLGDYITDCPYPQRTMDLLMNIPPRYRTWFIRGNREDYILKYHRDQRGWEYGSSTGALLYTYESLDRAALDWLSSLPAELVIDIEGYDSIYMVHVPPYHEPRQKLPAEELLLTAGERMEHPVLLTAHSHVPLVYSHGDRLIVNSGSLGVPNGETGAFFAVLESEGGSWRAEIVHLDYDIEAVCGEFAESGLLARSGYWGAGTMKMLRTGREYAVDCSDEVNRMIAAAPTLSRSDENVWRAAAEKIGLI